MRMRMRMRMPMPYKLFFLFYFFLSPFCMSYSLFLLEFELFSLSFFLFVSLFAVEFACFFMIVRSFLFFGPISSLLISLPPFPSPGSIFVCTSLYRLNQFS